MIHHHPALQVTRLRTNLHDSSDGIKSELGESAADMEISAIEKLTNAKLEVDRALDTANKTLHRLLEESSLELEAVTTAAELNSIKDKRVYTEMYESEADAKIISGKWVLKPKGRREGRRHLRQHDNDSISENAALSSDRPQKPKIHTVHRKRENRLPQRAHDGRRRGVREATTRVATRVTGSQQRHSDLETTEKSVWSAKRAETLAGPSGGDPQEAWLPLEHAGHVLVDTPDEARITSYSTSTTCC